MSQQDRAWPVSTADVSTPASAGRNERPAAVPSPIRLVAALRVNSAGTLLSRVLGMFRDMATAALFGLGAGGVLDAFTVAFRIPNLSRRLFGEGALSASFLPAFADRLEREGRQSALELASALIGLLAGVLVLLVLVGELVCALLWQAWAGHTAALVVGLTAVMLPYLVFMCLAAQVKAALNTLGHFSVPALAPVLLNVCWLVAVLLVAPRVADSKPGQAYVLAWFVLLAGLLQLVVQWSVLRRWGFRFQWNWSQARSGLSGIAHGMLPMALGLAVTQLNILLDTLIAWTLARPPNGPATLQLFGQTLHYPMQAGAAASIYLGERLYQFPLGVFGVALGTVLYPLLSRHAARGAWDGLRADLTMAVRLVLAVGLPASVGLAVLAEPVSRLLFRHGAFTAEDAARTARMIAGYSLGVWAYCALQILVRAYYAVGNRATPAKVGAGVVVVNLALNLTLIWRLGEAGLAVATSLCAALQTLLLVRLLEGNLGRLEWGEIGRTSVRVAAATLLMAGVCVVALWMIPAGPALGARLVRVAVPLAAGMGVYLVVCRILGVREISDLLRRHAD